MSLFIGAWQLVIRRSLANWRLLSSILIGILVAVALLSSIPLYYNALSDLGLNYALQNQALDVMDVHVYGPYYPLDSGDYQKNGSFINQQVEQRIGSLLRQEEVLIKSQSFYVNWTDRSVPEGGRRPYGYFQSFTNLDKHINLLEGRLAESTINGIEIEAMIGPETAQQFDVGVGDQLIYIDNISNDPKQLVVKLVGIIEPIDINEEYWFGNTELFYEKSDDQTLIAPIFVTEDTMFAAVGTIIPSVEATYHWYFYTDVTKINTQNAENIKNNVGLLESDIVAQIPRSSIMTNLDSIITKYQQNQVYAQIPLFLLIFQIVGIVFYYLITVTNMIMEQESGEISQLRSRGASVWQIISIYLMEGIFFSVLGGIPGPFLGAFIFSLLGTTKPFYALSGGGLLPIRFTPMVIVLAIVAIVLCVLTLLIPAIQSARHSVVYQRQHAARPPRSPFWQRYYLDIALLVIGGMLYWEVNEHGSVLTKDISGKLGADPLPLITPLLFIVAAAIILLRVFPLLIKLVAKISGQIANAPLVLSLRYMARNPIHYGRLVLLLMMAAAVGVFSASFLGTLNRGYQDHAAYAAGSDIRIDGVKQYHGSQDELYRYYSEVPGVEHVSFAYRGTGSLGVQMSSIDANVLFIDPTTFGNVAWYRDDFSDKSFKELLHLMNEDQPREQGITLPDGTEHVGVWLRSNEQVRNVQIYFRIQDGEGNFKDFILGQLSGTGWQYLEIDLADNETGTLPPSPLIFHSIYVKSDGGVNSGFLSLYFDSLQVNGTSLASPVYIEDFENIDDWTIVDSNTGSWITVGTSVRSESFYNVRDSVHDGETSGCLTLTSRRGNSTIMILPNLDTRPMAMLASSSFLKNAGVSVGDTVILRVPGQYVPIEIKGVVDYFPTLDPDSKGFLIGNINRSTTIMNLIPSGSVRTFPTEVWLSTDDDMYQVTVDTLQKDIWGNQKFYDMKSIIAESEADPLVAGGWSGILMIAFGGVILVSALGFVVYAYLSARNRQLEFAVLRTLGFSLRDIIALVGIEQLFIIGFGFGIGTLLGTRISSVMMPFLQLTERGTKVVPPFLIATDWQTIGIAYSILILAFVFTISLVVLFFSRVALHRVLRIGDQ